MPQPVLRRRAIRTIALYGFRYLLVALWLCAAAAALDPSRYISQYAHKAWRTEDGDLVNAPTVLTQTSDGYLWIGTLNGLFRFDGVRFVLWGSLQRKPLPSDYITSLLGTRDGSLWIGTSAGLARWNDGVLTKYSGTPFYVEQIAEGPSGGVWVARAKIRDGKGVLCEVSGEQLKCYGPSEGIPFPYAKAVTQDSAGNIWVGGPTGLCRWRNGSGQLYSNGNLQRLQDVIGVNVMTPADDASLWVGTIRSGKGLGLQQFKDGSWKSYSAPGLNGTALSVSALFVDRDGTLWIGTENSGIYRVHAGQTDHFTAAEGLSGDEVNGFFQDREGSLWVATSNGVDRFHDTPVTSFSIREGLISDEVTAVLGASDGTVWMGNTGALNFIRNNQVSRVQQKNLPQQLIASLFEDHEHRLWVGVDAGLDIRTPDGHFLPVSKPDGGSLGMIVAMTEDTDHNLWAETALGSLLRIRDAQVVEQFSSSEIPRARDLAADPQGGIWLALENGNLGRFRNGRLEVVSTSGSSKLVPVYTIKVDPDGSVWASTGDGLVHWRDGTAQTLNSRNGLACDTVVATVRDNRGNYWLESSCGYVAISDVEIERWLTQPDRRVAFRRLDRFDGARPFPSTFRPSASKSTDGRLWFATDTVLQMIDPRQMTANALPPPVHIEQVIADRKAYLPASGLELPPHTRDIEIDYTALSFVAPQKVRFRYQLKGRDAKWQDTETRRQAFYSDLSPGTYQFRVIASNNDGVWNETGATLNFRVLPAFYQTTWFRVFCFALFAFCLWLLYRLRLRQLAARMQARLEERLEERERIARDLHDTLLQGFVSAYMQLDVANDRLPAESPAKPLVQRVLELMKQVSEEGRSAIRRLRSPLLQGNDLEEMLSRIPDEFSAHEPVDFRILVEGGAVPLHAVIREEVGRIAREAVINAFRHSRASKIEVEIKYGIRDLAITVRDNGCGMDQEMLEQGREGHYGLSSMRERAEKLGCKLVVTSRVGLGTEVQMSVPGRVAFVTTSNNDWWRRPMTWLGGKSRSSAHSVRE